jgi:GTPase SAR1 family protein
MSSNLDYHVVVLGGGAVGKSAVTVAFIHSHFIERYGTAGASFPFLLAG